MARRHEVGRQLEAEQPVLLARGDGHGADLDSGLRGGLPDPDLPVALDVEDAPVGRDVELERVLGVVVERDLLEVRRARRGHPVRATAGAGKVRHGADAAEQVRAEDRVGEGLDRVAAARVERVAAGEVRAPGDRVVIRLAAAVLLVVGRLVETRKHVDVVARAVVVRRVGAGRRRLVVVPLVRARPAGRKRASSRRAWRPRRRSRRWAYRADATRSRRPPDRRTSPSRTRCRRGVDADVAVAGGDVALEGGLLSVAEDVARGRQEDDGLVLGEVRVVELASSPRWRRRRSRWPRRAPGSR